MPEETMNARPALQLLAEAAASLDPSLNVSLLADIRQWLREHDKASAGYSHDFDSITMLKSDWQSVSDGMMKAIHANMQLLAERTELRTRLERLEAKARK